MVLALICLGNNRQDSHPPNCMFSCLQILEAFLWFVLITLLNVTLIILTLSVSRLLNLLLRLRSEERFSRNAETDLVCRLLLEKKKKDIRFLIILKNLFCVFTLFMYYTYIFFFIFFFIYTATTDIYTLSLHDALPIFPIVCFHASKSWRLFYGSFLLPF